MKKAEIEKLKAENAALSQDLKKCQDELDAAEKSRARDRILSQQYAMAAASPEPEALSRLEQGAIVDAITRSEHATIALREILRGVGRNGEPGRNLTPHSIKQIAADASRHLAAALALVGRAVDVRSGF